MDDNSHRNPREEVLRVATQLGYFTRRVGKAPNEQIQKLISRDPELVEAFLEGAIQADFRRLERKG